MDIPRVNRAVSDKPAQAKLAHRSRAFKALFYQLGGLSEVVAMGTRCSFSFDKTATFALSSALSLTLILLSALLPAAAQYGGTGDGNTLQGGVSARDRLTRLNRPEGLLSSPAQAPAFAPQRQSMTVNLNGSSASGPAGLPARGFFDNGRTLQGGLARTERVPPEVFRAWLNENHPTFALSSQTIAPSLIVDVAGRWDHADKTLTKLGINFNHVKTGEISPELLASARVLIINCAGDVKRDKLQYIRDFVQRGGYLLTTDWALNSMLEQTFPGYVEWNRGVNNRSIYSATYINPDPILARGCVRSAPWKIDAGAHLVRVLKPDTVRVLIASAELAGEERGTGGVLACLFPFGKGYVMHMVGHFDNNATIAVGNFLPDPAPQIKISLRQALAANFVVAGVSGEPIPSSGRFGQ